MGSEAFGGKALLPSIGPKKVFLLDDNRNTGLAPQRFQNRAVRHPCNTSDYYVRTPDQTDQVALQVLEVDAGARSGSGKILYFLVETVCAYVFSVQIYVVFFGHFILPFQQPVRCVPELPGTPKVTWERATCQ